MFKSFADLIDDDLLIAKPVILAATAGTARQSMVVDAHVRSLFAFLRAIPVPTSLYAAPQDWGSPELGKRIARAAAELAALVHARQLADENWDGYQHQFAGNATRGAHSGRRRLRHGPDAPGRRRLNHRADNDMRQGGGIRRTAPGP